MHVPRGIAPKPNGKLAGSDDEGASSMQVSHEPHGKAAGADGTDVSMVAPLLSVQDGPAAAGQHAGLSILHFACKCCWMSQAGF